MLEWRSAPVNSNSVAPSTAAIEAIAARRSKLPPPGTAAFSWSRAHRSTASSFLAGTGSGCGGVGAGPVDGGDRNGQDRTERVPSATPVAGVGELGEVVGQAAALVGCQRSGHGRVGDRGNGDDEQAGTAVHSGHGL